MKPVQLKFLAALFFSCVIFFSSCNKKTAETTQTEPADSPPSLIVPYFNTSNVTYIQPFGVPLDFGGGDIRPHAAVDFGCGDGVEFVASASGTLGNIWLEYPHSYQFNIIINDKYIVHYCMEPVNIASLSDADKLAAIYFSIGDPIEQGQKICKMVGGPGHLDWGLIKDDERVCPACYLSAEEYNNVNTLFKSLPGTFEGYDNLCPDNTYHTNPRQ